VTTSSIISLNLASVIELAPWVGSKWRVLGGKKDALADVATTLKKTRFRILPLIASPEKVY
jgi:hypothetical protein